MDLPKIWSQVPADYFSSGIKTNLLQKIWHAKKLEAVAKSVGRKKINVLVEVGSADGSFVNSLSKRIKLNKIIAIDPYLPPLSLGKKMYPNIIFIQADAHFLPLGNASVDLITILETLEHVADPYRTLMELKRILKKNGLIIVEIDSGSWLFQAIWFFWKKFGKGKVWSGAHLTFFNVELLEGLFEKAGLKVEEKKLFNWGMGICFRLRF
ncbi:methyltransferase domain-containing protein [Candidatus Collierbacteria bacterium]|nr:methyltransferase domain-containing protein [Candidatus Collierbacteria bacterium]